MIKAVVLDIDGVIVGNQKGINFPHPSKKVSAALRTIHDNGLPVSFLTAKPSIAASENIKAVGIDNPHIADGGATIFNPIRDKVIFTKTVNAKDILLLLRSLPKQTYVNLISIKEYYLQKDLKNEFTDLYGKFLGRYPLLVDNIEEPAQKEPISKINIVALQDKEKEIINHILDKFSNLYSFKWTTAPLIAPIQVMVVTAKGISKRSGVITLADYLKVSVDEILGVGDTIQDWDFLEICGYKAAMGNAHQELKDKLNTKDKRQVIGGHIDEDGLLDIFKYFKLLN